MSENLLEEIQRRLNAKTIHDLRQVARAVGVPRPADGRKERIVEYMLGIAAGTCDPVAPAARGAHPKSAEYDRQLVADIHRCREAHLTENSAENYRNTEVNELSVGSGDKQLFDFVSGGVLEKTDGKWFLRVNGCTGNILSDIFVNEFFVKKLCLREGDFVSGKCKRSSINEMAGLVEVFSVNGEIPEQLNDRPEFDSLPFAYPDTVLKTKSGTDDVAGGIIDILSPLAKGQRAFVVAPHGCGKTQLLKKIALGIKQNNPAIKLIILTVEARPEEVADFKASFADDVIFTSGFDSGAAMHVRTACLAFEYAKRQVESAADVVLVVDDLTRLTRAFNNCSKQISALDNCSLESVKKLLASAKNTGGHGSLTILSALTKDGGDPVDDAVYYGLKDLCNMRVTLSQQLTRMRIFPPFEISETYASGDERLLSPKELQASVKLRGMTLQEIAELVNGTASNEQLVNKLI